MALAIPLRTLIALALLATPSLLPLAAPEAGGVTIPHLRVGDAVEYRSELTTNRSTTPYSTSHTLRSYPYPLETVEDIHGAPRLAVRSRLDYLCEPCAWNEDFVEATTGNAIYSVGGWETSTLESEPLAPGVTLDSRRDASEAFLTYRLYPGSTQLLRGKTILPGDVVEQTAPRLYGQPPVTVRLTAIGWESTALGVLFRVRLDESPGGTATLWFEDGNPFPVSTERVTVYPETTYTGRSTLVSRTTGGGPLLFDASYDPAPPLADGMIRTTYTEDGPIETIGVHLELADAARIARAQVPLYFGVHPDAYVTQGRFEDTVGATIWDIRFRDGPSYLSVRVVGSAGQGAVANLFEGTTEDDPPREAHVGRSVACFAEALRVFELAPRFDAPLRGEFNVYNEYQPELWCELHRNGNESGIPVTLPGERAEGSVDTAIYGVRGQRTDLTWNVRSIERDVRVG